MQFVGNKLFAFRDRSPRWIEQAALFGAIEALGACLNVALFDWAVRALPIPYLAFAPARDERRLPLRLLAALDAGVRGARARAPRAS